MLIFQQVNFDNIDELVVLADAIWHEYWKDKLSDEQIEYMLKCFQSKPAIIKQIINENYQYYFINNSSENIGYFGVTNKDEYLFLSKLYISKDYRAKGFGRQTFEKIKKIAQLCHKNSIQLTVNKYNTDTINAYKKWGLKQINSLVTDIGEGFVMDDYIMEYRFQHE